SCSSHSRRPHGRVPKSSPTPGPLAPPHEHVMSPAAASAETAGLDRYSAEVFLSYGRYGFYFDHPGEYLIRAVYQGRGEILIPSDTLRIRGGHPADKNEDRAGPCL